MLKRLKLVPFGLTPIFSPFKIRFRGNYRFDFDPGSISIYRLNSKLDLIYLRNAGASADMSIELHLLPQVILIHIGDQRSFR